MGIIRHRAIEAGRDRYADVQLKTYSGEEGPRGTKQIVIGPDDGAPNFAMRVFHIDPGKASAEDEHPHDHGVLILNGRASVLLGAESHEVQAGDVVWVKPNERHQLRNVGDGTLSFLCVVPAWGEPDAKQRPAAPGC
jgi:quercetin dioxygenase-like cupin family protein